MQHGEKYRIHVYATKPDLKERKTIRDMFFVGLLEGEGYTSAPTKRSLHAALPYGYELVALSFDEYGIYKWDSLPIHIDQWFSPTGSMITTGSQELSIQDGMLAKAIIEQLKKELKPGGLLHKAKH